MYYLKSHIISSRRTKLGDFVNSESQNSNQMQQGNVILMKGELGDFWWTMNKLKTKFDCMEQH